MKLSAKRFLAGLLSQVVAALALLQPAVATAQFNNAAAGQFNVNWTNYPATPTQTVAVPGDNWTNIGNLTVQRNVQDRNMISGDRWIVLGHEYAGALGLSSDEVANTLQRFPNNAPIIFARYVPQAAQLRIQVARVIRDARGTQSVWTADFTPHHGQHYVAHRFFLSDSERTNPFTLGHNPFASFRGPNNDPTFYNISLGSAHVALGHAMARFGSALGIFVELGIDPPEVTQTSSGNIFRRTITTTYRYHARPSFSVAVPLDMSSVRNSVGPMSFAAICPRGAGNCTDERQVAIAGVVVQPVSGGNIPNIREQIYVGQDSQSGWTAFFFTLITAFVTWGVGMGAFGMSGGWTTAATSGLPGATTMGAAQVATYAAGVYAGASTNLMGQSVFNVQQGWLGSMGWDPRQIGIGTAGATPCTDRHCTGAVNNGLGRMVGTQITDQSGNMQGTRELITGQCAPGSTLAQCQAAGQSNGIIPRPDSHLDTNTVAQMKAREGACRNTGLTGADLRRCIGIRPNVNDFLPN